MIQARPREYTGGMTDTIASSLMRVLSLPWLDRNIAAIACVPLAYLAYYRYEHWHHLFPLFGPLPQVNADCHLRVAHKLP